jgi:putative oxidoreductase
VAASTKWFSLFGRVALVLIFLISGLGKIGGFASTASLMASKGLPAAPLLLVGAILLEVGGSLSVLAGYKTRWGALALMVFLIPVSLVFHNFWAVTGPEAQQQMINFLKNVSILGGLAVLYAAGPGPVSLDAKLASGPSAHRESHEV